MSQFISHHDENRPESCEHLWHLALAFSLCLTHKDGSRVADTLRALDKVCTLLIEGADEISSADIIFSLRIKGVWLNTDFGQLTYVESNKLSSNTGSWELVTVSQPPPKKDLIELLDFDVCKSSEDVLEEVMDEILMEMTAQSIIFFTFIEIEATWRERLIRKNQRRILQQVKDSKVQTLGEEARIVVGDQVKTLTTAVDIQLLQDITNDLEENIHVPTSSSDISTRSPSPASSISSTADVPVPISKVRKGSVLVRSSTSFMTSFDTVLAKKDKITSTVALALHGDGVFQNMLRDGVRVMVHYENKKSSRSTRRVQRVMKWRIKKIVKHHDDAFSIGSNESGGDKLVNKLEFYQIDAGVIESEPEGSIVVDDIVEVFNGAFTKVFQDSMTHLHGSKSYAHNHHYEREEHEKRCFSMVGCLSYFDGRKCVDIEILPRNKQFVKEVNAAVLVAYGVGAAVQIISNMNNENPALSHMTRATDIISVYHRYNMRHISQLPSVHFTLNPLCGLHTIDELCKSNAFPPGEGYPSEINSMNYQLQEVSNVMENAAVS